MSAVLFDTNIILDIALQRKPHYENATALFSCMSNGKIDGFITATTITDIYYITKKTLGSNTAFEFISDLVQVFEIIGVDKEVILHAISADMKDFEDAIQVGAAALNGIEIITTRNKNDFKHSDLTIYTPEELLEKIS